MQELAAAPFHARGLARRWKAGGRALTTSLCVLAASLVAPMAAPEPDRAAAPPSPVRPPIGFSLCSALQTDYVYDVNGRYDAVVQEGHRLVHYYWRHQMVDGHPGPWTRGRVIAREVTGPGCIIQSDFDCGSHHRLDVLVPKQGGIVHYTQCDPDDVPDEPWGERETFGPADATAASFIQSDFDEQPGTHHRLDAVVLHGKRLVHYRNDPDGKDWEPGRVITDDAMGPASLTLTDAASGDYRNFALVVPESQPNSDDFKIGYYYHVAHPQGGEWEKGQPVLYDAAGPASLILSDYCSGDHCRLDLVVPVHVEGRSKRRLVHVKRVEPGSWERSGAIGQDDVTGAPTLFQRSEKTNDHGSFEVLTVRDTAKRCHSDESCLVHDYYMNSGTREWLPALTVAVTGDSQKICQLTGERDTQWDAETVNRTFSRDGVGGTDLGPYVEHDPGAGLARQRFLFFGDTPGRGCDRLGCDSYARIRDDDPENCLGLEFLHGADPSVFEPFKVDGAYFPKFEVPSGGYSAQGNLYVFATTGCRQQNERGGEIQDGCSGSEEDRVNRAATMSFVAKSTDDGATFRYEARLSWEFQQDLDLWKCQSADEGWGAKFIKVAAAVVDADTIPNLHVPHGEKGVLLWGTGKHRNSEVYLAFMPILANGDPYRRYDAPTVVQIYHYSGNDKSGLPVWGDNVWEAERMFNSCTRGEGAGCVTGVGEVSVIRNDRFGGWLMMYDQSGGCVDKERRGIFVRTARNPWGPWSEPLRVFNPDHDGGRCQFIDGEDECRNDKKTGCAYGPYVLDAFTRAGDESGHEDTATLYYVMSTWHPYQVVLMRTTLRPAP